MDTSQIIEQKANKFKKWISVAILGVTGLIVSPFIFMAIGGIIGLAIAVIVGLSIVQFAPVVAQKIANIKYRMLNAENVNNIKKITQAAQENPIETLTALLQAKHKAFVEFVKNVEVAASARDTFKDKVKKFAEKYPERAPEFQAQLQRMTDLVEKKKQALQDAKKSLEAGDNKLEEMKAYWEMSKDAIALNKAAGMDTGDAFEKLKSDTACDIVFQSMNTAFAQLEVAAALDMTDSNQKSNSVPILDVNKDPLIIDVNVTNIQKVRNQ